MSKSVTTVKSGLEIQNEIIEGVRTVANAVGITLGPAGKCVAIQGGFEGAIPEVTRDGATVAKSIRLKNEIQNIGAQLVRKAAESTEEQVGDSTSSTCVLIRELCEKGRKAAQTGSNINEVKSGMMKASKWITDYIAKNAIPIEGDLEKIRKVATISANNDPVIGNLVVECMEKVGTDGVITADLSYSIDTTVDITTGMKLDRGWTSPHYVTSPNDGKCILDDPLIVVAGEKLANINQLAPLINKIMEAGSRPFLIICDDADEMVNATLAINNMRGAIRCCVVKGLDFGDSRKNLMQDIATMVGATYLCPENGIDVSNATIDNLGGAKKVVVSRDSCIIYEGKGSEDEINARADILRARLNDPSIASYDKTKFEKRLAGLTGGIGIIRAGGASEVEKINKKATIEDSILASKSAISEGCAPGCGYIYLMASLDVKKDKKFWKDLEGDEVEGAKIVFSSLPEVMRLIAENSGVSGDLVLNEVSKSKKKFWGYNAKTKKYGHLLDEGILDSAKALRVAIENSISAASMILLVDCSLTREEVENTDAGGDLSI